MQIILLKTQKKYKVFNDDKNQKYIRLNKTKTTLSSLRGKYRYIKQNGGESMSWAMNADGKRTKLNETYDLNGNKIPFFRKYFNSEIEGSDNEKYIAHLIQTQQNKGKYLDLVRILNITDEYYDAELLETYFADKTNLLQNIKSNLDSLNKLNIIYIDIKIDNMGYSHIDKQWKLFDFDSSGVSTDDANNWKVEAPFHFAYKTAFDEHFNLQSKDIFDVKKGNKDIKPLTLIDDILYDKFKEEMSF
jgi:hypothetical protein